MKVRAFGIILLLSIVSSARATSDFLDTFMSNYKVKDSSALGQRSCGICHISDSDTSGFNPYGRDLKKALADHNATSVDAAILQSVEAVDSDGDGTPNGKEIVAGTAPGDPKEGGVPGVKAPTNPEPAEKKPSAFPPKNGFHPAIVHFPIALFIGGLILDFIGMLRKDDTLLRAGWYNIVLAAVTSLGAIVSGVLAMFLKHLPYKGLIFTHLGLAVASTVLMWVMVGMRVHRHQKMNVALRGAYYVLAVACLVMISYAGHLGGVFVYGE